MIVSDTATIDIATRSTDFKLNCSSKLLPSSFKWFILTNLSIYVPFSLLFLAILEY